MSLNIYHLIDHHASVYGTFGNAVVVAKNEESARLIASDADRFIVETRMSDRWKNIHLTECIMLGTAVIGTEPGIVVYDYSD